MKERGSGVNGSWDAFLEAGMGNTWQMAAPEWPWAWPTCRPEEAHVPAVRAATGFPRPSAKHKCRAPDSKIIKTFQTATAEP